MQPLNNLTSEISTTNGSSVNTNDLLDSLSLGKFKINKINFLGKIQLFYV